MVFVGDFSIYRNDSWLCFLEYYSADEPRKRCATFQDSQFQRLVAQHEAVNKYI